jgi:hypothetical protein
MTAPPGPIDLEALIGTELPNGRFRIDPDDHRRAMAIVGRPDHDSPVAHPVYGHIALNGGMGIDRADFFALCGSTLRSGALLGRAEATLHRPLLIGAEYTVGSRIAAAERKQGSSGLFDLVTVHLTGRDETGALVAEMDETYVFLRSGDA